jgi:hypothetical protein
MSRAANITRKSPRTSPEKEAFFEEYEPPIMGLTQAKLIPFVIQLIGDVHRPLITPKEVSKMLHDATKKKLDDDTLFVLFEFMETEEIATFVVAKLGKTPDKVKEALLDVIYKKYKQNKRYVRPILNEALEATAAQNQNNGE